MSAYKAELFGGHARKEADSLQVYCVSLKPLLCFFESLTQILWLAIDSAIAQPFFRAILVGQTKLSGNCVEATVLLQSNA